MKKRGRLADDAVYTQDGANMFSQHLWLHYYGYYYVRIKKKEKKNIKLDEW